VVLSLQRAGFEISLHNVAPVTSARVRTRQGLDRFQDLFGASTFMNCHHDPCEENVYWGDLRLTGLRRTLYNRLTRRRQSGRFRGHVMGDPIFWGDLCWDRISYVRNFAYEDLNTLKICPEMPYHDPAKPFVKLWFASTDAAYLPRFLRRCTRENIDRLVAEGGLSILNVHFGDGFAPYGTLNGDFRRRMEYVASQDGWFAPVSSILDHLRVGQGHEQRAISHARVGALETRWLAHLVRERFW